MGSIKDIVLRGYLERELIKEFTLNKLMITSNLGINQASEFNSEFRKYTNMHFFQEGAYENMEEQMRQQYELIRKTTPKLFKTKAGHAVVSGLSSHLVPPNEAS